MKVTSKYGRPVSTSQGNTREAIVAYLKENITGTTQDFIDVSGDNDNNVRRAVRFLDANHTIKCIGKRKSNGVGNPAKLWTINQTQ